MSKVMTGVVTIVQESRFQLTDDEGVSHMFVLAANAAAEAGQLTALQSRQARVSVRYDPAPNLIGNAASAIYIGD